MSWGAEQKQKWDQSGWQRAQECVKDNARMNDVVEKSEECVSSVVSKRERQSKGSRHGGTRDKKRVRQPDHNVPPITSMAQNKFVIQSPTVQT